MKKLMAVCVLTGMTGWALAAAEPSAEKTSEPQSVSTVEAAKAEVKAAPETVDGKPPLEMYEGQDLDIEKVISIQEAPQPRDSKSNPCRIGPVDMLYEDSKGKEHDVEYLEQRRCGTN